MSIQSAIHQVRLQNISLVKTGEGGKFKFASFFDVMEALQLPLQQELLSVGFPSASLHDIQTANGPAEFVRVQMEVSNGTETAIASYDILLPEAIRNQSGSAVTNAAQRTANAITYGKRIGLLAFFNIAAGDEDDVERMTPAAGQSNIPGQVHITDDTAWTTLVDGTWQNVMNPLGTGLMRDYLAEFGKGDTWRLWGLHPNHPALCAWGYDLLQGNMEDLGYAWQDVTALDPSLPAILTNCTPAQLRAAATAVGKLKKSAQ